MSERVVFDDKLKHGRIYQFEIKTPQIVKIGNMNNWDAIKEKYQILFQKYLNEGLSRAAADELAILEARELVISDEL